MYHTRIQFRNLSVSYLSESSMHVSVIIAGGFDLRISIWLGELCATFCVQELNARWVLGYFYCRGRVADEFIAKIRIRNNGGLYKAKLT